MIFHIPADSELGGGSENLDFEKAGNLSILSRSFHYECPPPWTLGSFKTELSPGLGPAMFS